MKCLLCLLGFLVSSLHAAVAQAPIIPELGSRVRVTTERRQATGTLESVDSATIVVRARNGKAVSFQRQSDFDLDVSAGPGACGEGRRFGCVALGFLGGGVVGVGVGAVMVSNCDDELCGLLYLVTVPAGALVGTVVGALVGGEHWNEGELPATAYVAPAASGASGLRVGVQLRF